MEKYVKKVKITLPTVKIKRYFNKWKALTVMATVSQFIALFTPWLWQKYAFAMIMRPDFGYWIFPPPSIPEEAWLWSFMAVVKTLRNEWQIRILWDYWFNPDTPFPNTSFLIFIFQSLTMVSVLLIAKKAGFNRRLKILAPLILSLGALFFCIIGISAQPLSGYPLIIQSQPFIGFWFAISSSFLFLLSLIFYRGNAD